MKIEEFDNTEWYIVYVIYKNGSKSIYGINNGKTQILHKNQLKTVKSYLKKQGLEYEVYNVSVEIKNKVEV